MDKHSTAPANWRAVLRQALEGDRVVGLRRTAIGILGIVDGDGGPPIRRVDARWRDGFATVLFCPACGAEHRHRMPVRGVAIHFHGCAPSVARHGAEYRSVGAPTYAVDARVPAQRAAAARGARSA